MCLNAHISSIIKAIDSTFGIKVYVVTIVRQIIYIINTVINSNIFDMCIKARNQ